MSELIHGNESLVAQALEALGSGLFICDARSADCPVIFLSPGFSATTRYSAEDILGRGIGWLFSPENDPEVTLRASQALAEGSRFQAELLCARRAAAPVWCELILAPIISAGQWAGTVAGRLTEVSMRKKRQDQLEDAEARFRGMFENAVEGIYQSTPQGRYLAVNPALARMYGYASPQALMESVSDISSQIYVDPAFRERFQREIERSGQVLGLEYEVRRRDGSKLWISECARAVRARNGQLRYYEGFISDISARKAAQAEAARLEKQVIQAHKMEAIGTMAGGIAHDFNNMLCVILGYTELTLGDQRLEEALRRNLESVLKSGNRAKELVRQILAFSHSKDTKREPVKLSPLVKECVKLLKAALPASIQVQFASQTDADVVVADATEIHQVMMNLGNNAMHAMRRNGGILEYGLHIATLALEEARPLGLGAGTYICLTVRDTGHGMSPEVQEHIFDPFFTTKGVGEGTGLGLALVRGIVIGLGGQIAVESQVGVGSTFRIYLPQSQKAPVSLSTPPDHQVLGQQERLLVVDDEMGILSLMQQRLRRMNYRVVTRADSREALATVRADPDRYDLVITDHTMPHLLGADLAEKLGQVKPELPVILMTGLNQPPGFANSPFTQRRMVIRKPIDFAELSRQLRRFLEPAD